MCLKDLHFGINLVYWHNCWCIRFPIHLSLMVIWFFWISYRSSFKSKDAEAVDFHSSSAAPAFFFNFQYLTTDYGLQWLPIAWSKVEFYPNGSFPSSLSLKPSPRDVAFHSVDGAPCVCSIGSKDHLPKSNSLKRKRDELRERNSSASSQNGKIWDLLQFK